MNVSTPGSLAAAFAAFKLGTLISEFRKQFHFQAFITEAEFALFSSRDTNLLKERLNGILSEYNSLISQIPEWAEMEKLPDFEAFCNDSMNMLDSFFGTEKTSPSNAWKQIIEECTVLEDHRSDFDEVEIKKVVRRITALVEAEMPDVVTKMERVLSTLGRHTKPFFDLGWRITKLRWLGVAGSESEETDDSQSDANSENAIEKQIGTITTLVRECNEFQPLTNLAEYPPVASGELSTDLHVWQSLILMKLENSFLRSRIAGDLEASQTPVHSDAPKYYSSLDFSVPPEFNELVTIKQIAEILTRYHSAEGSEKRLYEWKRDGWGRPDGSASGADAWLWGKIKPQLLRQISSKRKGVRAKT